MEPLAQINCPACGSPALVQESVTTLRCENCNSVVQRSTSTSFLEVLVVGCYSCGATNDKGIKYCTSCGAELIVDCPGCGNPTVLGKKRCGQCSADIYEIYSDKVASLGKSIKENNQQILKIKEIIDDTQSSLIQASKRKRNLIIPAFFISLAGSIFMMVCIGLASNMEFIDSLIVNLCIVGPITGGIIFTGIIFLVVVNANSRKNILEKKNVLAAEKIKQAIEEKSLIENELSEYLILLSAYKSEN